MTHVYAGTLIRALLVFCTKRVEGSLSLAETGNWPGGFNSALLVKDLNGVFLQEVKVGVPRPEKLCSFLELCYL